MQDAVPDLLCRSAKKNSSRSSRVMTLFDQEIHIHGTAPVGLADQGDRNRLHCARLDQCEASNSSSKVPKTSGTGNQRLPARESELAHRKVTEVEASPGVM